MSGTKTTCPGCSSTGSDLTRALEDEKPCPHCGLSAAAIIELMTVRESRATEALKDKVAGLVIRADKAERERNRLKDTLREIRFLMEDLELDL